MTGTENIKATFRELIILAKTLAKILQDGKISWIELIGLAPAATSIPVLVEKGKLSLDEFRDLTTKEAKEVANYIAEEFSIDNKDTEAKVEAAIFLLSDTYEVFVGGWGLYGRWKVWAESL